MSEPQPDLSLIAEQLRRLINNVGSLRDDMTVLTATAMQQDHTLSTLLTEVRLMHSQHSRLSNRRALEEWGA